MKKTLKKLVWAVIAIMSFSLYGPLYALDSAPVSLSDSSYVGDAILLDEYKLGPGDEVAANLIVGESDLSLDNKFIVGPDGKIFFPKIGEIDLLGLTIPQSKQVIDEKIKSLYKEKYEFSFRLVQPRRIQIYLSGSEDKPLYIGERKYVYVYGQVPKSGRFEYLPGKKFTDYISYAGGPLPQANLSATTITRQGHKYSFNGSDAIFNGNQAADMAIEPGDVINVPTQFIYFSDLGSFSATLFTLLALYNTFVKR
jgi:protein involved in polysaccharide export with SLBB domain